MSGFEGKTSLHQHATNHEILLCPKARQAGGRRAVETNLIASSTLAVPGGEKASSVQEPGKSIKPTSIKGITSERAESVPRVMPCGLAILKSASWGNCDEMRHYWRLGPWPYWLSIVGGLMARELGR